jgi:hypothetical protein
MMRKPWLYRLVTENLGLLYTKVINDLMFHDDFSEKFQFRHEF